jgi:exodeoxyribonuclease VII large subunit
MKMATTILTVSDLTRRIKGAIEMGFSNVSVQGEISNCKRHSSGHIYFTLKDEYAQIQAVVWRSRAAALLFTPQDGMKVVARGKITVYEVRGVYQIDVNQLQPLGAGELQLAFEQLKQKLAALGYFDPEHKKPIPPYPERIGIVTSPTGAAIRDIINIVSRRSPFVELILYPVNVQGSGASEEIAGAIKDFNTFAGIDVMIVGRGGGSMEDLWAFNEEAVASAIYHSAIPIVSAVGHEIDFTIADFVADLRAPTPSAAAEMIIRSTGEMVEIVRNFYYTAEQIADNQISVHRERILTLLKSYSFNRPVDILRQRSQQMDELRRALVRVADHRMSIIRQQLLTLEKRIGSLNPDAVLERGYAMVIRDGRIMTEAGSIRPQDEVDIKFHDGHLPATIH